MRREIDTSRATCDTCGRPYQEGDAVYSIADRWDESIEDRDVLVSFRHWACHTPAEKAIDNLRGAIKRVEDALRDTRR